MRTIILTIISVLIMSTTLHAAPAKWWVHAEDLARKDGYRLVNDQDLADLGEAGKDYLLVDARPDYEFEAGHLPGAVHFEFDLSDTSDPSPERLKNFEKLAGADKSRPIVVYCRSMR